MCKLKGFIYISELNFFDDFIGMDVVVEWFGNGCIYFFKGDRYWCYGSWYYKRVDFGYFKKISVVWWNVFDNLDVVL